MGKTRIQELLEEAGYECRSYSGRGMMGKECVAVCTDKDLMNVFGDILNAITNSEYDAVDNALEAEDAIRIAQTDQFGKLGIVLYFPGIEYVKEEETDE